MSLWNKSSGTRFRFIGGTRAGRPVAQKVWQTSGTITTDVTVAHGSRDLWKMWQTSGSGRRFLKNRDKLVLWQISGKLGGLTSECNAWSGLGGLVRV